MNKLMLLTGLLLSSNLALATESSHWTYSGEQGPDNWAQLSHDFSACDGKNQSPVNLTGFIEAELKPVDFNYKTGGNEILNNGHTVQVNYAKGSSIKIDGEQFDLLQFHFHAPSENHINGKSYPLEAHFVHADAKGNLAVVALMFAAGKQNSALATAWSKMPEHAGDKFALPTEVNADKLLPTNRDYYSFNGSLTTPPCSEGVRWLVMKETATVSDKQLKDFKQALHEPNNRPVQPLNARAVLQ